MEPPASFVAVENITRNYRPLFCHDNAKVSSTGVWLGAAPLSYSLPLFIFELAIVILTTNVSHFFFRRLGQPKAVSQMFGGAIMGLSGIGRKAGFITTVFPQRSYTTLNIAGELGLLIFFFLIGVKTDLNMLKKSGKKAVAIGLLSTFLPVGLMNLLGFIVRYRMPLELRGFVNTLAVAWSRTSFAVLSCVLDELNLLNSKVGRLAMSATLVSDLTCTVVEACSISIDLVVLASDPLQGLFSFVSFLGLLAFIVYIARPLTMWLIRKTPEGEQMDDGHFLLVVAISLICALVGEVIGHHATSSIFFLGLALPSGPPLGSTLQARYQTLVQGIFIPLFVASGGFRMNLYSLSDAAPVGWIIIFVVFGTAAKVAGILAPCYYWKVPLRDAASLMLMMLSKGIFEVYVFNSWSDSTMIDMSTYSVLVLSIVVLTAVITPLFQTVYRPSKRYIAHKRRNVEYARRDGDLRLLICLHIQENLAPIVNLLDAFCASKQSPICICALHIKEISGHAAATLAPYEKRGGSASTTETDQIVKALRFFEQENQGTLLLEPYVAISPRQTMHDDVCTMALEKKVALIVLPFHKHMAVDGTMEALSALKTMNLNVLRYAPCSVGILVDHGAATGTKFVQTKHMLHHIGLYFIGGADDREALACVIRMAENPAIGVTMVRFRSPADRQSSTLEDVMDDEIISRFRLLAVNEHDRLSYMEEIVKDGEDTIGIIRYMSHSFSLLVAGRRHGLESPLTEGLSMWSEYPELGVLGDLLAATDFGAKVSTLVIQQQNGNSAAGDGKFGFFGGRFNAAGRVAPGDAV